jgi:hypothetical protein
MSGPGVQAPPAATEYHQSRVLLVTVLVALVVLGLLLVLELVAIPVHVSPANGSIRCGNPPKIGVFHLNPAFRSDGTYGICASGESTRRVEAVLTLVGGILGILGILGLSVAICARRSWLRTVGIILGVLAGLLAFGSLLAALGNTFLWD